MAVVVVAGCTDYKRVTVNPVKQVNIDQFDAIISNKGFSGLVVVFGTWCGPCRNELSDVADIDNARDYQGLQVIALSVDSGDEEKVQFLVDDLKLMVPVYQVGKDALKRYRIFGIPTMLTVKAGNIVEKVTGQQTRQTLISKLDQLKSEISREPVPGGTQIN